MENKILSLEEEMEDVTAECVEVKTMREISYLRILLDRGLNTGEI